MLLFFHSQQAEILERRKVDPPFVCKQSLIVKRSDGALQMQALSHFDRSDRVAERAENRGELPDAFSIGAPRQADEQFSADPQNVSAFESRRLLYARRLSIFFQLLLHPRDFSLTRKRARTCQHGYLIDDDRSVFDEAAIGEIHVDSKLDDIETAASERIQILLVLTEGESVINRSAVDE